MTFNSANHDSEIWEVNIEIHNTTCTILTKQKKETTTTLDMVEGKIELRDQLRDYEYRGDLHSNYNFLDFIINTYEDKSLPEPQVDTSRKVGWPQNRRIPYLPAAGKPKRCRVHQESGNFLLPLFPPFSALYSCIRQKKEEKEEQKETNLFLFLLMGKRQKKEEKGASPSFFSLL